MSATSHGTFDYRSYCRCGGSMRARGRGDLSAAEEVRAAWLVTHTGPGHGEATREQAARARRRAKAESTEDR